MRIRNNNPLRAATGGIFLIGAGNSLHSWRGLVLTDTLYNTRSDIVNRLAQFQPSRNLWWVVWLCLAPDARFLLYHWCLAMVFSRCWTDHYPEFFMAPNDAGSIQ